MQYYIITICDCLVTVSQLLTIIINGFGKLPSFIFYFRNHYYSWHTTSQCTLCATYKMSRFVGYTVRDASIPWLHLNCTVWEIAIGRRVVVGRVGWERMNIYIYSFKTKPTQNTRAERCRRPLSVLILIVRGMYIIILHTDFVVIVVVMLRLRPDPDDKRAPPPPHRRPAGRPRLTAVDKYSINKTRAITVSYTRTRTHPPTPTPTHARLRAPTHTTLPLTCTPPPCVTMAVIIIIIIKTRVNFAGFKSRI